jgi:hypothetical protein
MMAVGTISACVGEHRVHHRKTSMWEDLQELSFCICYWGDSDVVEL